MLEVFSKTRISPRKRYTQLCKVTHFIELTVIKQG